MPSTSSPARKPARRLGLPEAMLGRPVNDGFSGGERKRNELLQLALLQPRLAVLDEVDSGMDVDGVHAQWSIWCRSCARRGAAFIVVTHYLQIDRSLQPDAVLRRPRLHCRDRRPGLAADIARRLCARATATDA